MRNARRSRLMPAGKRRIDYARFSRPVEKELDAKRDFEKIGIEAGRSVERNGRRELLWPD